MQEISGERSKILLLCLGFDRPKQQISGVKVHDLLNIFGCFGSLRKIMIFSKTTILKAFVEFGNASSAQLAQEFLHETSVDDLGEARLYVSERAALTCSDRFLDFWDVEREENLPRASGANLCLGIPRESTAASNLSAQENQLVSHCSLTDPESGSPSGWVLGENRLAVKRFSVNSLHAEVPSKTSFDTDALSAEKATSSRRMSTQIPQSSKVLLLSNLNNFFGDSKEIFNLFSCFGNLNKILFMKNLQKAMIEFDTFEGAQACLDGINCRQLETLALRASFSKYPRIDVKKNNKSENSLQFNDMLVVSPEHHRFKSGARNVPFSPRFVVTAELLPPLEKIDACLIVKECVRNLGVLLLSEKVSFGENCQVRVVFTASSTHGAAIAITRLHGRNVKGCPLTVGFYSADPS